MLRSRRLIVSLVLIVMVAVSLAVVTFAQNGGGDLERQYVGQVPAPPFPADVDWLNVDQPLTIDGLRGKIIILDFWTYGCINCIHMIPVLEQLEEKYADELVVIGVHSAKFENEGQTENVRQIVQRYGLHHPVINDPGFLIWRNYQIRAWPSFVIVSPRGNVVAIQAGEVPFEAFDQYLSGMVEYYDDLGTDELNREPLELALEGAGDPGTPLLFPGKVLVDGEGGRLFIADSSHHRIVIVDLNTYEVLDVVGSGQRGLTNASYENARFSKPQGMELVGETLYIADTENHVIRAVNLQKREVTTVAGNGQMGQGLIPFGMQNTQPTEMRLRSPWDVELGDDNELHIAMAGTHQLWALNLETDFIRVTVGNGREANLNDVSLADAELAQPSGLFYRDGLLYFADSESSTIRVADFNENQVRVVAGTIANDLFDFGDIDGELGTNRLQHALGVALDDAGEKLYIADTYNSRIKVLDLASGEVSTLTGAGELGGYRDGSLSDAGFDEPGGLEYYDGKLYVADTNNHVIRIIDLEAETVDTITFTNPQLLELDNKDVTVVGGNAAEGLVITLDEQTVAEGNGEIVLQLILPDGFKINDLIESSAVITTSSEGVDVHPDESRAVVDMVDVHVPAVFHEGEDLVSLFLTLYYCETEENSLCFIEEVTLDVPVIVNGDGASEIAIERTITPPELGD